MFLGDYLLWCVCVSRRFNCLMFNLRFIPSATGNQIVSVLKLADSNWGISDSRSLPSPIFVPSTSVYAAQPDSQPYMTYPDSGHAAAAGGAYSQVSLLDVCVRAFVRACVCIRACMCMHSCVHVYTCVSFVTTVIRSLGWLVQCVFP